MKYRLEQDTDAESPRSWDNAGTMICFHRRYNLGDKHNFDTPDEFWAWWKENGKGGVCLPLYLYDHGGLTMNTTGFSCSWDSGRVGYIYLTRETILKEWGKGKRVSPKARKLAEKCLLCEVQTFDQFLTGDVWGYIVEDDDGNNLDSCWGFFGDKYAHEEGKRALAYCLEHAQTEANAI